MLENGNGLIPASELQTFNIRDSIDDYEKKIDFNSINDTHPIYSDKQPHISIRFMSRNVHYKLSQN